MARARSLPQSRAGLRKGGELSARDDLPRPAVPPALYDDDYYLGACAGSEEWARSEGHEIAPAYPHFLARAELARGEVLLDVGTGRGELLAAAVDRGAARAIGVEYSDAAVRLARRTLDVHGAAERAEVVLADARALPLDASSADVATMLDVVEHLSPVELRQALAEVRRVLRPGGRLLVHTFPNRTVYEVTYRLQRAITPARRRSWPANPRTRPERLMHVNEQTVSSLRRTLRDAGFADVRVTLGEWVHAEFVPAQRARRLYSRLGSFGPTARLGRANLWGEARNPG